MIKFSHSIFALPFALTSAFFATQGKPTFKEILLITLCMVTARNAAMSFNRIVDRDIDALNSRTQDRPLVNGKLSLNFSILFCTINVILFILFTSFFNQLTLLLSPIALGIILGYSLTKRFTHFTQFFLGLALAISPLAAWIALTGTITLFPILLAIGVFFWVSGFDLIYSTQDFDFDKKNDLKNLVVKLGIKNSLWLSRTLHLFALTSFLIAGSVLNLNLFYFIGIGIMAAVLVYEHSLVKPDDLSKVNLAFFTLNGYVSITFFSFSLLAIYF